VATAGVNRMMLWTDLEGREVMGRWRLERLVRPEGRTAWFDAVGANGEPLILSITETLNDDDELLARLEAAARIRHPNVVALQDAAGTHIDDTPVVLVAMEVTEENLADVLRDRALSVAEAQMVLEALVQGLAAIHAQGLVHARMEAGSVLAMGETIKLRSDCLIPGEASFAANAAENVRGLGRIITQAVTRRMPASENDPLLQLLPEPMARAIRRALSGSAQIEEIATLAGIRIVPAARGGTAAPGTPKLGPVVVAPRVPRPDADSAVVMKPAASVPSEAEPPAPRMIAIKPAEKAAERNEQAELFPEIEAASFVRTAEEDQPAWRNRRSAPLVMGAAAIVVLATVFALYGVVHRDSSATPTPSNAPTPASKTQNPAIRNIAKPGAVRPIAPATTVAVSAPGWRVVAYTYNHEAQAQQKAETLKRRYSQLTPGVFTANGRAPWLVTLGGVMSKADAVSLRNRAVSEGLPGDTYAQNYR
jgi:eukaryotic-like serine/threonine-protein kinase